MREFPPFRFDNVNQCLLRRGESARDERIELTPKAYAVLGYLLDRAFHTHFLYIPFLILGIAAGFVQLIRQLMRDTRDNGS